MNAGFDVALNFVALGIFWLIIASFMLGIVDSLRRLLG
jgi:hypothetical protein